MKKGFRKQHILETLTLMLEAHPGRKITTAKLAAEVGVSEAALYRHFPSKTKMYEALIEFVESTVFTRVNNIIADNTNTVESCYQILTLILVFSERNPGISSILSGDALSGEDTRLRIRISQFYDRIELQLKNILQQGEVQENIRPQLTMNASTSLLLGVIEGKISKYVRSHYKHKPTDSWDDQWPVFIEGFFKRTMRAV